MPPSSPSSSSNATMSAATVPPLPAPSGGANGGMTKARATSPRGVSTLMYACQQGDVEKVRRLLRAQPTAIEKKDRTGKTALHYCCTSDNICAAQAADLLVMAAPDLVESHDEDGFTPLHLAVIAGNMPLVTFLLANNADVNAVDSEKHTVVHWATVCGETGALRAVLAAGAPVSTPDIHGGYPLHYAAQMCGGEKDSSLGLQVIQALLQHPDIKVNVEDGEGRQPLLWASSAGSAKAVLALIRAGATVDAPDKDGLTALHCAASRGHTDCIDTLLTLCGMSPDVIDSNGCTALHYSVTLGHADATALLLAHGADPNRQDRKGRSPAHCGCAKGQFETVKLIGNSNANLWLKNARGDLPLHEAAASGRRDLVKWLLEARPSQVNAKNNDGRCPLHLAALNDNADMCKILLDAGAQVNPVLRTSKNIFMTPLDCALQRGFRSTAKYLQLHGGVPANRLSTSKTKIPNGTAGFHVREDLTLWADSTSDSERENGEKDEKTQRRQRRKLAYRYEKKRDSGAPASDGESKNVRSAEREQQRTSRNGNSKSGGRRRNGKIEQKNGHHGRKNEKTKENVTYNSEVKITNNYGGINIEKNGEIIIGSDGYPIIQGSPPKAHTSKPKMDDDVREISEDKDNTNQDTDTANEDVKADKMMISESEGDVGATVDHLHLKSDTNNNNKIEITQQSAAEAHSKPQLNIDENIEEIKTLANTIEQTAKSITKEVIHIQQNLQEDMVKLKQVDQHSLLSNTSIEESEHKELVVEASIHAPPKETENKPKEQDEQKKDQIIAEEVQHTSPKESLKPVEEELIATGKQELLETQVESPPEEIKTKEVPHEEVNNETKEGESQIQESQSSNLKGNADETTPDILTQEDNQVTEEADNDDTAGKGEIKPESSKTELEETKDDTKEEDTHGKETLDPKGALEEPTEDKEDSAANDKVEEETRTAEEEKPLPVTTKEDTSDISIETPDTVKLAEGATLEDPKTINDTEPKIDSTIKNEDKLPIEEVKEDVGGSLDTEQETSKLEETNAETEDVTPPKEEKEFNAEGVTAVNVENKSKSEQKKKFIKEKKTKKAEEDTPKEKIKRDRTPKGDESVREVKPRKQKIKVESKSKGKADKSSDRKDKLENNTLSDTTKKEKTKERIPTKAIEKILEVTQCGTSPVEESHEKLKKRKKLMEEKAAKRKSRLPLRDTSKEAKSDDDLSSSSTDSVSRRKHKHRSFTVLENGVEKRRVRIAKTKSPRLNKDGRIDTEEVKITKTKRSKIPIISNLKREMSISDQHLDRDLDDDSAETRISLPNLLDERHYRKGPQTGDLSALPPPPSLRQSAYSDNERSASEAEEVTRSATRRRKLRKRMKRDSRSAGSDYESSNLIDSGFEPSPRSSRIPKWRNMSERGVCMTSVTQSIQSNIRRYHLERKIFQHLLELKRLQIRSGQHNETVLVKRAIDDYHNSCAATVGAGRYVPEDYSFKSFEKFLYHSLRKLQKDGSEHLKGLPETPIDNPLLCTQSTHRCAHATHAYTGIPCAAYLPKMDHHTIPKIGYDCKPSGFLPHINTKKTVTLELCHGGDKQVISLPTDRLDQNKRYYVTFTVKGNDPPSPLHKGQTEENAHRHAKSV